MIQLIVPVTQKYVYTKLAAESARYGGFEECFALVNHPSSLVKKILAARKFQKINEILAQDVDSSVRQVVAKHATVEIHRVLLKDEVFAVKLAALQYCDTSLLSQFVFHPDEKLRNIAIERIKNSKEPES